MRLTNADTAKRALIDALTAQTQITEPLYGVQVEYVDPAQDAQREAIFLGAIRASITWDQDFPREVASFPCYVQVIDPAGDPRVAEQRAVALGTVVLTVMLANKLPAGAGSWWQITAIEATSGRSADESKALLTLLVQVQSHL